MVDVADIKDPRTGLSINELLNSVDDEFTNEEPEPTQEPAQQGNVDSPDAESGTIDSGQTPPARVRPKLTPKNKDQDEASQFSQTFGELSTRLAKAITDKDEKAIAEIQRETAAMQTRLKIKNMDTVFKRVYGQDITTGDIFQTTEWDAYTKTRPQLGDKTIGEIYSDAALNNDVARVEEIYRDFAKKHGFIDDEEKTITPEAKAKPPIAPSSNAAARGQASIKSPEDDITTLENKFTEENERRKYGAKTMDDKAFFEMQQRLLALYNKIG